MGPYAYFAIIPVLDKDKNYNVWNSNEITYKQLLSQYQAISISDDIINDWWYHLLQMNSYCGSYSKPDKALDRWGNTLIPPESLDLFINVIETYTSKENWKVYRSDLEELVKLLKEAKTKNNFVIHFGV